MKDVALVSLKNVEYRARFLELNEMTVDIMNDDEAETDE